MKFLRISKITEKLTWLQYMLTAGFVVIALTYAAVLAVESRSAETTAQLSAFRLGLEQARINILEARRSEKDFLLRMDVNYLEKHEAAVLEISRYLKEAQQYAPTPGVRDLVNRIGAQVKSYNQAFKEVADRQVALGLDEESGLHGAMRKAVHEVEGLVNEFNNPVLMSSLLMMRRHEKDFIQRVATKYIRSMEGEQKTFATLLENANLPQKMSQQVTKLMASYYSAFKGFAAGALEVNDRIEIFREEVHKTEPLLIEGVELSRKLIKENKVQSAQLSQLITIGFAVTLLVIAVLAITSLLRLSKGVNKSLGQLVGTVHSVAGGDFGARCKMDTPDELGELGQAFDDMLNDRVSALAKAEEENETLNNSVIELMEALSELSNRDLTIIAPVAEDVTGTVADAINMMASETARVLKEIQRIAKDVESVADNVRNQGDKVSNVAKREAQIVHQTTSKLGQASRTMNEIAVLANKCNEIGVLANSHTTSALQTVSKTAAGMADVRETISESEKRIKRLGERSQEISAVIEIINSIAERTQVLALNASMQAAAAGDAGRGFAVVANEVQRLAESSRQSTSEIEALVRNIQTETSDAMMTMNKTIEQVVNSAELAEQAGQKMDETQRTTTELADAVKQIAKRSIEQAKVSKELQQQSKLLHEGNLETDRELDEQSRHTESLAEYSKRLVESVSVFKLPA